MSVRPWRSRLQGQSPNLLRVRAATPICAVAALAIALLGSAVACAQGFPSRPVRLVVPVAAGGLRDVIARAMGPEFHRSAGQTLVVDNRTGGGGLIAGEIVANATPDGYTLFMASGAEISIAPALHPKLPYDPRTAFVPVTRLIDTPMLLFSAAALPVQSVKELVALAREKPGAIVFASSGPGSVSHLAQELFAQRAGITFIHVPYRGAALALADIAAGRASLLVTTVTSAKPLLDAGRVRALAVAADKRTASLPEVPTFEEAGVKGVDAPVWAGIMAPKGTPATIVSRLDGEFRQILANAEFKRLTTARDAQIAADGPAAFARMIREDMQRWARVVSTAKVKLQ
ncbi:MAG TPA: tripartite tricarboxylate transporter substrate binding protein [Burkholderiales bacterium]|nr:tripartite tricarboxylate transporter substrate binding protein [Burkholderiales bacterium]